MRKIIGFVLILATVVACNTTNKGESAENDVQSTENNVQKVDFGTLYIYPEFKSEYFHDRDVLVWLPEDYDTTRHYAVLYMHDGQMLFDKATSWNKQSWNVDSVATAVQKDGRTRPFIVVGINNHPESRLLDYMPRKALGYIPEGDTLLAKYNLDEFIADNYLKFIVSELKPFIDKTYSTLPDRDNTFIMGSSMGGLISMYAICEYPDVFGGAGCLSTHTLMIPENAPAEVPIWSKSLLSYLNDHAPTVNSCLIYMDRGDQTTDAHYAYTQKPVDEFFISQGWDDKHFQSQFFPGHAHDENSWESRLHIPFTFLMK